MRDEERCGGDGATVRRRRGVGAVWQSDFAMLTCATNFFQRLVSGDALIRAADRNFPTARSVLVFVDCGGAAIHENQNRPGSGKIAICSPDESVTRHQALEEIRRTCQHSKVALPNRANASPSPDGRAIATATFFIPHWSTCLVSNNIVNL